MRIQNVAALCAVVSGVCGSAALATVGPVAWWKFDNVGSGTASDSAGAASGTLVGPAVMINGGIAGGALDTRNGGWADMGNVFPMLGTSFSMSLWIKTTDASSASTIIAGKHSTGTFNGYMMRANRDTANYGVATRASFYQSNSPANTAVGTSSVTDGSWHHLTAVYVLGGNLSLYVDGGLQATIGTVGIINNSAQFVVGGAFTPSASAVVNYYRGLVDELQLFDRALTPAEVTFLKNNPGATIPAPAGAAIVGLGLVSLGRRRRR